MIDFHSHILPGIDDGSSDIGESLEMLRLCVQNGVETVVLTPHCYYTDDSDIKAFIHDRNAKFRTLKEEIAKLNEPMPQLLLGCELHLNKAHAKSAFLKELAMECTSYIMLEMPMGKWEPELYDAIYSISIKGLRPLMAHIDRYWYEHEKDFHNLFSLDLSYQVNCDSFLHSRMKRKVPYFFERGAIHVLGSDMHNLTTRTTHMSECCDIIKNKYGENYLSFIHANANRILHNEETIIHSFPKMTFMQKIKL